MSASTATPSAQGHSHSRKQQSRDSHPGLRGSTSGFALQLTDQGQNTLHRSRTRVPQTPNDRQCSPHPSRRKSGEKSPSKCWETHDPGFEPPTCLQPHPDSDSALCACIPKRNAHSTTKNVTTDALCSTFYDSRKWKPPKYLLNKALNPHNGLLPSHEKK